LSIKAVVFDFGNVLSLPQAEGTMERLASLAGAEPAAFERLLWSSRGDYDRGAISGLEYYGRMLAELGLPAEEATLRALLNVDLESWARLNPASLALLEDIRKRGLRTGILSNMPHEFLALTKERFPELSSVDAGIYSCEVGVNKPAAPIYESLLAALGLEAPEVAFFDDIPDNIEGARRLGIHALLWTDAASGRRALSDAGVAL